MKKWLTSKLPSAEQVRNHPKLKRFGKLVEKPELWQMNERTLARAVAIGLFSALMPIPCQMVLAAGWAIAWRANIFVAVALVWVSNPITLPAFLYLGFWLGTKILHMPLVPFIIQVNWVWIKHSFYTIGLPLLVGSLVSGAVLATIGYFCIHSFYRFFKKDIPKAFEFSEFRARTKDEI